MNGELTGIYVAKLLYDVNKYRPGAGEFNIPAIMSTGGATISTTTNNNQLNLNNKDKSNIQVSKTTTKNAVSITIPPEIAWFYPKKIIPAGSIFYIAFVGGDRNKPIIVGRDINGYVEANDGNLG